MISCWSFVIGLKHEICGISRNAEKMYQWCANAYIAIDFKSWEQKTHASVRPYYIPLTGKRLYTGMRLA